MHITVCERCELLFIKGKWSNFYLTDLEKNTNANAKLSTLFSQEWDFYYRPKDLVIQELIIHIDEESYKSVITGTIAISASPDIFVPLMRILEDYSIRIKWGECTECRTRLAGSYQSKIQIRSPKEVPTRQLEVWSDELKRISQSYSLTDRKNPLFKINFLKSGVDALFRSKPAANYICREFANKFGGIISVTTEFAGFDKSKSKEYPRKPVVLINMPKFNPGEMVLFNHQPIQILNYNSKVEYWDFTKMSKEKIPIKSFLTADLMDLEKEVQHFQLVNFEEGGKLAQIMNTQTYEIIFVDSSDISHFSEGATFKGIFYNGKLLRNQKKTNNNHNG